MKSLFCRSHYFAVLLSLLVLPFITDARSVFGQVSATTWDKPQEVKRQAKPKRVYRPRKRYRVRPATELSPLLTVQYRVLIRRPDGSPAESSLASVFHAGDRLRLGVTANQDGFLYVIHQKEGQDGQILFPDSRVNNGENYVGKNQEFILPPANCSAGSADDCWYPVTPDREKEFFIFVFSRDQITDLSNNPAADEAAKQALAQGILKREVIESYIKSARLQDYKVYSRPAGATSPTSRYAVWVTNLNRANNEEIVLRVPVNKGL